MNKETIYWDEDFKGRCKGGFFTRCNLKENIKHFEEKGYKVIGIRCSEDSDWNLEFICEEPKSSSETDIKEKQNGR